MRGNLKRLRDSESGAITVLIAAAMILMFGLASIVIDLGNARQIKRREQNSADAGSLAGARELQTPGNFAGAKQVAIAYVERNMFDTGAPPISSAACPSGSDANSSCYAIGGVEVVVTTPYTKPGSSFASDKLIYVEVCQNVDVFLAAIFNVRKVRPCARAVAGANEVPAIGRGVVVLDPDDNAALLKEGTGTLTVNNGHVIVDSISGSGAQCNSAQGGIFTTGGGVTHVAGSSTGGQDCFDPDPLLSQPPIPDPLAGLPVPTTSGLPTYPGGTYNGTTLQPGVYTGPVITDGTQPLNLSPGVYVFQGGFKCSGAVGKTLNGSGVFFYIGHGDDNGDGLDDGTYITSNDQNPSTASPKFITEGSCVTNLSAPTSGPYESILLFQARGNDNQSRIAGNGSALTGTIYVPSGTLRIAGEGSLLLDKSMLVTNRLNIAGGGGFTLNTKEPPQAVPGEAEVSLEG